MNRRNSDSRKRGANERTGRGFFFFYPSKVFDLFYDFLAQSVLEDVIYVSMVHIGRKNLKMSCFFICLVFIFQNVERITIVIITEHR